MRNGGEFDHESCGAQVVERGAGSLRACVQYGVLKLRYSELTVGLPKGDQPHAGDYQIGDIAVQKYGDRHARRNPLPGRACAQDNGQDRLELNLQEEVQATIG